MESAIPKNSINTPSENEELAKRFQKEEQRLRDNNLNLKMQIIEAREKIQQILKIMFLTLFRDYLLRKVTTKLGIQSNAGRY